MTSSYPRTIWTVQPEAVLNQAAPVNGTWYTVLAATKDCRVRAAAVNVEDANETLEMEAITSKGTIAATAFAATHSTNYYAYYNMNAVTRIERIYLNAGASYAVYPGFLVEDYSVQIRVRKTTALGAGNLTSAVIYATKPE